MAIQQISTSNTFSQWLTTTQALVDKYNYYEFVANSVFDTANIVYGTSTSVNIKSNTVNSQTIIVIGLSASVNSQSNIVNAQTALVISTYNSLQHYVNVAYSTSNSAYLHANAAYLTANQAYTKANGAYLTANQAYTKANLAYTHANSSYNIANLAYSTANSGYTHANSGYTTANDAYTHANSAYNVANLSFIYSNNAYSVANAAQNTVSILLETANTANLAFITDDIITDTTQYLIFSSANSGLLRYANTSSSKLQYNPLTGTITSTNYNMLSDIILKSNVNVINNSISIVNQLDGVSFTWKDNGIKSYGVIAQELEKIIPELVEVNDSNIKSVNYIGIIAFLINSIKELNERLKIVESKI